MDFMDFEWNWINIQALARRPKGSDPRSLAAWRLWAAYIVIWAACLVPFYASGAHHYSGIALSLAGSYLGDGMRPAPLPEDVYGHAFLFGVAQAVACLAPCVFSLALLAVLLRLLTSWRIYSPLGLTLRIAALLLTLALAALSVDLAGRIGTWGFD